MLLHTLGCSVYSSVLTNSTSRVARAYKYNKYMQHKYIQARGIPACLSLIEFYVQNLIWNLKKKKVRHDVLSIQEFFKGVSDVFKQPN